MICQLVDNMSSFILKIQIKNFVQNFLMIFWGEILDTIFQKVPIVFWENFDVKQLPEYLSTNKKIKLVVPLQLSELRAFK